MKLPQETVIKGFTILEIVTTLAVVFLILGVALPSFNRYWQAYQLSSAAQQMFSNLDRGRYLAISKNRNVVVEFFQGARSYRLFEDVNGNGVWDTGEPILGPYSLPGYVDYNGGGLLGPPGASSPSPVSDPISFTSDRFTLDPEGHCNKMGAVYLQNGSGDANAISSSIPGVGRLRGYEWNRATSTWQ